MDRQKIDELPALQVQFFETTGIPVFKVCLLSYVEFFSIINDSIVYKDMQVSLLVSKHFLHKHQYYTGALVIS